MMRRAERTEREKYQIIGRIADMKKYKLVSLVLLMSLLLVSCQSINEKASQKQVVYNLDWPYYDNADSLVEKTTDIFEGEVVNITYEVIDYATGEILSAPSKKDSVALYTVYEIEVSHTHKGIHESKRKIAVIGGTQGYKEEEQLTVMKNAGILAKGEKIAIAEGGKMLTLGEKYLFLAIDIGQEYLTIPNMDQFSFPISDSETQTDDKKPNYHNIIKNFS